MSDIARILTSAGNVSTCDIFLIASTNGVLALFTISLKDSVMLLGLWNSKYVAAAVPQVVRMQPKRRIKPDPSCTNSNLRSMTKCHGKALQKAATPICRSTTDVEGMRLRCVETSLFIVGVRYVILYLKIIE